METHKGCLETNGHAEALIRESWEMTGQVGGEKAEEYEECEEGLNLSKLLLAI